jgi:4-hydroxy-3-polyprenylbenzoate decarboxylase
MSKAALLTMSYETDLTREDVSALADEDYQSGAIDAAISSGSFKTAGMIVAPCSVRSMSEIATGTTSTLLTRAADVTLKERRRLVLMVRETPLHLGHLRTMAQLAEMGAIIAPPVPAFYSRPETIQELVDQSIGRVLDLFDIEVSLTKRWGVDVGRRKGGQ